MFDEHGLQRLETMLQRAVKTAVDETAQRALEATLRRDDVEKIARDIALLEGRDIAKQAATEALESFLVTIGVGSSDEDKRELRKDFDSMRASRLMKSILKENGMKAGSTIIVGAFFSLIMLGIAAWFKSGGTP